jgi:hypothetical protein
MYSTIEILVMLMIGIGFFGLIIYVAIQARNPDDEV